MFESEIVLDRYVVGKVAVQRILGNGKSQNINRGNDESG